MSRLSEIQALLLHITRDCRPDMHEPDEQGVKAHVIGDHLDNAMGNSIEPFLLEQHAHELVVIIRREDHDPPLYRFNLADLIAIARKAELGEIWTKEDKAKYLS